MNTNAQTMAWFMDAYSAREGYTPAIVTGKPIALGGQPGREPATGRGVVYILEAYAKEHGIDLVGLPVIIQGFGNVGSWAAREAAEQGCRVVGVSDRFGGIYQEKGLDVADLIKIAAAGGSLQDCEGDHDVVTNEELLVAPCDVLIPAALDEQLHGDNAGQVQASVVIEAANYPTTPNADKIFADRGITVVPDILANAGGVTGSYFEWTRNIQQMPWTETALQRGAAGLHGAGLHARRRRSRRTRAARCARRRSPSASSASPVPCACAATSRTWSAKDGEHRFVGLEQRAVAGGAVGELLGDHAVDQRPARAGRDRRSRAARSPVGAVPEHGVGGDHGRRPTRWPEVRRDVEHDGLAVAIEEHVAGEVAVDDGALGRRGSSSTSERNRARSSRAGGRSSVDVGLVPRDAVGDGPAVGAPQQDVGRRRRRPWRLRRTAVPPR